MDVITVYKDYTPKTCRNVFKFLPGNSNDTYNTSGKSGFISFCSYRGIGQSRSSNTKSSKFYFATTYQATRFALKPGSPVVQHLNFSEIALKAETTTEIERHYYNRGWKRNLES